MKNKIGISKNICLVWGICLISLLFFSVSSAAMVDVKPGFYEQYQEYLKNMPEPTPLSGGASTDLKSVIPFYQMPFTVLNIDLQESSKTSYLPGEKIILKANLNYQYKGDENIRKVKQACVTRLKDENKCTMPEVHKIPEFNNLGVFVQVWRKDNDKTGASKGDYLVDEFYVLENQSLADGEAKEFSVNWNVPQDQKGGSYYLSFYLNQNKSFDLLGTPLTVFSETKKINFEVKSESVGGLEIDKNNIKINGLDYAYRKPAPTVKADEIKIELPLINSGKSLEETAVKYELYRFGRTNPSDLIDSKTENKSLTAGGKATLNYSFAPNEADSAYDLKITANTGSSKSSAYVRFALGDKNRGIIRFLALAEDGGSLVPMFCSRNANWSGEFTGKVKLTLGSQVWEKEGKIPAREGNCFMVAAENMKLANAKCTQLKGEIIDQNGKVTDAKEVSANCQPQKQKTVSAIAEKIGGRNWIGWLVFGLIGLIAVVIGVSLYLNNKKDKLTP